MASSTGVSGLISGMDTESIITAMLKAEKKPMDQIETKMTYESLKKEVLTKQMANLQKLKDKTLTLRLESTFKNKTLTSSDSSILSGEATMLASKGNYSVMVNNIAVPARAASVYSRASILNSPPNTLNVASISGRPDFNFDGKVDLSVAMSGSNYSATAVYSKTGGGQMAKIQGSAIESATVAGTIANTITTANSDLSLTVNGRSFTINVDFALQDTAGLKGIASDIQKKINDYLNTEEGTTGVPYVMVNSETIIGTGNEGLSFYNLNSNSSSSISFTGGNARALLGLNTVSSTYVTQITDKWMDTTLAGLRSKINDTSTGVLPGFSIVPTTGGELTVGSGTIRVNSQLRTLDRVYPRIEGMSDTSTSAAIDPTQTLLSVAFRNGTITYPSSKEAVFTINDVKVTIPDITVATVNDVLSLINTSGAGVAASYDSSLDRFILTGNQNNYATSVSLGAASDTTNFIQISGLSLASGGTLYPGSTSSSIDPESILTDAGFSAAPVSGTFTINGVSLYVDVATDTLTGLIDKINKSNAGVIASYDSNSDKITLKSDPAAVETNVKKINIGSAYDTSNLLEVLNLSYDKSTMSGIAHSGNRAVDNVTFTSGSGSSATVTIPATAGSGAYNPVPLTANWVNGIAGGATFTVNTNGIANAYTWTNNSGSTIKTLDEFITAWNTSSNWSGGSVEVAAVKEGSNQIRFFSRLAGATGDFTITEGTAGDAAELGISSGTQVTNGAGATATAEYNALNFVYSMLSNSTVKASAAITTDGAGGLSISSLKKGVSGLFMIADEATNAPTTVNDYFGEVVVKSTGQKDEGNLGQDAELTVDGVFYTRTSNKISDIIGGVDLQLRSISSSAVTLTVDNKTDNAISAVADFIFEYNRIIEELNPPMIATEDKTYLTPLTQDMIDKMKTTSEVEAYQAKYEKFSAYKIIRGEPSLYSFYSYMRNSVSTAQINGDPDLQILSDLGISAGSVGGWDDAKAGYLIKKYDSTVQTEQEYKADIIKELGNNITFMDALRNDENKVWQFFAKDSTVSGEKGYARRVGDMIDSYITTGGVLKDKVKANGYIDQNIKTMYDQYNAYQKRIDLREEMLRAKFNAMEETMARLQQQQTALSQKLGSTAA